jgi:hypothetical protein
VMLMSRRMIELLLDRRVVFRCVRDCAGRVSRCVGLVLGLCLVVEEEVSVEVWSGEGKREVCVGWEWRGGEEKGGRCTFLDFFRFVGFSLGLGWVYGAFFRHLDGV